MSNTQGLTPVPAIKCSNCGRENATGRLFCLFCGHRIVVRSQIEPERKGEPTPLPVDVQPLQASLEASLQASLQAALQAAQQENTSMQQQVASLQAELDESKANKVQPAPGIVAELHERLQSAEARASTLQAAGWEAKFRLAEEKAATFEKQLIAKAKELDAMLPQKPGANPQSNRALSWILSALAAVGTLGGYGAGHYVRPHNDAQDRANQLSAKLADAQGQINNLNHSLDATNQKANQAAKDARVQTDAANGQVDSANGKISKLTTALATNTGQQRLLQGKLSSTQTELNNANTQAAATERHVQQLEAEIQSRDKEISLLGGRIAALQTHTPQRSGTIIWHGTVNRKLTVQITDGRAGKANSGTITSGALPGTQCSIINPDPAHVKLKTLPGRKNNWNQLAFEVVGTGDVRVQLNWALAQ